MEAKKKPELLAGTRCTGESNVAVIACNDYLRLGPGRSQRLLLKHWAGRSDRAPAAISAIGGWSTRFGWVDRAAEYDAEREREKDEARRQVLSAGLALDFERVLELKELFSFLRKQLYDPGPDGTYPNLWVPDVKQIGKGEYAERVDIVRFNAAIVEQVRATLDDLAKETGGRVARQELTGKDGDPVQVEYYAGLRDRLAARLMAAAPETGAPPAGAGAEG